MRFLKSYSSDDKMGNLQANISQQVFSEFTQFISNNASSVVNKNLCSGSAGNVTSFQTGGEPSCTFSFINGNLNINQTATTTCTINAQNLTQVQTDIQNNIATMVQQFVAQGCRATRRK